MSSEVNSKRYFSGRQFNLNFFNNEIQLSLLVPYLLLYIVFKVVILKKYKHIFTLGNVFNAGFMINRLETNS